MIILKKVNIENCPYYFLNDMVDIKSFDPDLLSIDKTTLKVLMLLLIVFNISQ